MQDLPSFGRTVETGTTRESSGGSRFGICSCIRTVAIHSSKGDGYFQLVWKQRSVHISQAFIKEDVSIHEIWDKMRKHSLQTPTHEAKTARLSYETKVLLKVEI